MHLSGVAGLRVFIEGLHDPIILDFGDGAVENSDRMGFVVPGGPGGGLIRHMGLR
jgi:hypothetical protein